MISEHVRNAIKQLQQGEQIGRRGTPVISFWDMRPKWEKWGNAWEYFGSDGSTFVEDGKVICPAVLKLVYFRTHDGRVCQLAYKVREEVSGYPGNGQLESAIAEFESMTGRYPKKIC